MRSAQRLSVGDRRAGTRPVSSPDQRDSRGKFCRVTRRCARLSWSTPKKLAMLPTVRDRQWAVQSWRSDKRAGARAEFAGRRRPRSTVRSARAPPSSDRLPRSGHRCRRNNAATALAKHRRRCRLRAPMCLARHVPQAKPRRLRLTHRAACPHFRG